MKNRRVLGLVFACGLLSACEPAPQNKSAPICAQATGFIELNSLELQEPRDWNRLVTAASRLVYLDSDCGDLVTEPKELLCASLIEAINIFANNPQVPKGPNRDQAISVGTETHSQSGCEGLTSAR